MAKQILKCKQYIYIYILAIFLCLFEIGGIKSYAAGYCSETEGTDLYHSTFRYISFFDDYGAPIYRWGGQLINTYNPYTWEPYQAVQTSYSGSVTAGGNSNGTYTFYINNLDVHVPDSNYRQWKYWNVFIDIETRDGKHACKNLESTQNHIFKISGGSSSLDNIKWDIDMTIWPQYGGQSQELCRYASGTIKINAINGLQVKKVTLYMGKSSSYYGQWGMGSGGSAVRYMKAGEILNGYNITFNTNGGAVTIPSQTAESITLPNPGTRPGYTFDGWYNDDTKIGDSGDKWKPTADATITAHWTPITYRIQYLTYGGYVTGNPVTYNVETPTFTLKNPTQMNMSFTGWSDRDNNMPKEEYTILKGTIGDITVSANWKSMDTEHGRGNSNSITSNKFTVK